MKMFYTNSSAKEEIGNLEARIGSLESDATASASEIATLTAELKTTREELATLRTEHEDATKAVETSEASLTKATADLAIATAKLDTFDADVELAAQAKFASLGGSPLEVATTEDPASTETDMLAHYEKLEGQEKRDFLAKNGVKLQSLAKAKSRQG